MYVFYLQSQIRAPFSVSPPNTKLMPELAPFLQSLCWPSPRTACWEFHPARKETITLRLCWLVRCPESLWKSSGSACCYEGSRNYTGLPSHLERKRQRLSRGSRWTASNQMISGSRNADVNTPCPQERGSVATPSQRQSH